MSKAKLNSKDLLDAEAEEAKAWRTMSEYGQAEMERQAAASIEMERLTAEWSKAYRLVKTIKESNSPARDRD